MRSEKKTSVRPPRGLPNGMPWLVRPSAKSGCARMPASGRRGCNSATPLSKAVGCISSRPAPLRPSGPTSHSHVGPRGELHHFGNHRAAGAGFERNGDRLDRQHGGDAWPFIVGSGGAAENVLHLNQLVIVRETDAVLNPMMDIGLREPPLPTDLAAGNLAAVREPGDLRRREVQVSGQTIKIKISFRHGTP